MKVCIIIPPSPWLISDLDLPFLGPLYLSAFLKREGYNVTVMDLSGEKLSEWWPKQHYDYWGITGTTANFPQIKIIAGRIRTININAKIIAGGAHATLAPFHMLKYSSVDICVMGPGEKRFLNVLKTGGSDGTVRWHPDIERPGMLYRDRNPQSDDFQMAPIPDYEAIDFKRYLPSQTFKYLLGKVNEATIITTLGCPWNCLGGKTLINTINGLIPIKELVDLGQPFKVLTRDPKTKSLCFVEVKKAFLTRKNAKMVRVLFDDNTHIDCTPDHLFIKFKNGNQYTQKNREYEIQAIDLKKGDSVRAVKFAKSYHRNHISWARRKSMFYSRLVMEGMLGRKLLPNEYVHHIDRNYINDLPENLVLTDSKNHFSDFHPEISERMKINNPNFIPFTKEHREQISTSNKGKKRTLEQRLKYRESKLGPKNPRWTGLDKRKRHINRPSGILKEIEINHKVISVSYLQETEDVYCMEVSGYNWFYANNVLVHNCNFCGQRGMRDKVKFIPLSDVEKNIDYLRDNYNVELFYVLDDTFGFAKSRFGDLINLFKRKGIKWHCLLRADLAQQSRLEAMSDSGCLGIVYGFESGSNKILGLMNKETTVNQNLEAARLTHEAGMMVRGQMIVGFPGENDKTIAETKRFIKNAQVDIWGVHAFQPYPGSNVWYYPEKYGIKIDRESDFSDWHTIGKPGEKLRNQNWIDELRQAAGEKNIERKIG